LSTIRHYAPDRRSCAIEVGPGSGVYLPLLLELFERTTAFDIEERYLEAACQLSADNPRLSVQLGDITDYARLKRGGYDLVLCSEVIEHVPRDKSDAAFAGLRKIMADDGVLILSTPHRWSSVETIARIMLSPLLIRVTRLIYGESVLELGHINLMTRTQVHRALQNAGFEIINEYAGGLYIPIAAEFFGATGLALAQWLEPKLRGGPLHQMLWTQFYVARALARSE